MPQEHEVAVEDVLQNVLGEHCPWAPQSRVQDAAQLLARRMTDIGVDEHESFTMTMFIDALNVGHELAKIMGPAPVTPGTPVTPGLVMAEASNVPYGLKSPYGGIDFPWNFKGSSFGGQYFHGA